MGHKSMGRYYVGIICALHIEVAAVMAMLDEEYDDLDGVDRRDDNTYVAGRMHKHNVIIAGLPTGDYGMVSAASVANDMRRTFKGLRFGLLVGIGGALQNEENGCDIRLGDVVVSQPHGTHGGVIQFDSGKSIEGGTFERTGLLNRPPTALLTALQILQARNERDNSKMAAHLSEMIETYPKMKSYTYQGRNEDRLFHATYRHRDGETTCGACESAQEVHRQRRETTDPLIHHGTIISGSKLIKDAALRDRLGREFGALCVETQAAGLMNNFPCLVIRGICDYADSHRYKRWRRYAAATAAAYTKELLSCVSVPYVDQQKSIREVVGE